MGSDNYLKFLGTAGTRFVMARQLRSSGGVFLRLKGRNIILDPGPGALVRCAASRPAIDPGQLDAVILTHLHIDHANDVNVLIDAMTDGGFKKRGVLFAPAEALEGENAVVLRYLRGFLAEIVVLAPEREYHLGELTFRTSVAHLHHAETCGVKFDLDGREIAFLVDTRFFPGLLESYAGADVLVMNVVRSSPADAARAMHLCLDDARAIAASIRPRQAILTHFGLTMLKAKPWELAARLAAELGLDMIAATDGLKVEL